MQFFLDFIYTSIEKIGKKIIHAIDGRNFSFLVSLFKVKDPELRKEAVLLLSLLAGGAENKVKIADAKATPLLLDLLGDPEIRDPEVKENAAMLLSGLALDDKIKKEMESEFFSHPDYSSIKAYLSFLFEEGHAWVKIIMES